jgi:hypothetical protein
VHIRFAGNHTFPLPAKLGTANMRNEISRRIVPVKRIAISVLLLAAVALLSVSCGTSDYVESLALSASGATAGGSYNLSGVDFALQLQVQAVYHSGKTIDVTNNSTWTVSPVGQIATVGLDADPSLFPGGPLPAYGPTTVPISTTGLMQGIAQICTWVDGTTTSTTGTTYDSPPQWAYTGYYQVTATYRNFTSNPIGVGVGVAQATGTSGCGPSNTN